MASVLSVSVGSPSPRSGKATPTGIEKVSVPFIEVADPGPKRRGPDSSGFSGVAGDFIGSGWHHGGSEQAVYAVARARSSTTGGASSGATCPTACSGRTSPPSAST